MSCTCAQVVVGMPTMKSDEVHVLLDATRRLISLCMRGAHVGSTCRNQLLNKATSVCTLLPRRRSIFNLSHRYFFPPCYSSVSSYPERRNQLHSQTHLATPPRSLLWGTASLRPPSEVSHAEQVTHHVELGIPVTGNFIFHHHHWYCYCCWIVGAQYPFDVTSMGWTPASAFTASPPLPL